MKKLIISLIATLGLGVSTQAQENTLKGHVWKVTKAGKTHYLGGSIHALKASDLPIPEAYNTAFDNAKSIVFETDIAATQKPEFSQKIMMNAALPEGKTLKDFVSDETYQKFDKVCQENGIPTAQISRMKPMMGILAITFQKLYQSGYDATKGVDQVYFGKATANNTQTGYLETIDEQINYLLDFDLDYADDLINKQIKELGLFNSYMNNLVSAWKSGDIKSIDEISNDWQSDFPKLYENLILKRNANWLEQLPTLFDKEDTTFVLVGAGHLYGEKGLIPQLEKQGYQFEQL